MIKRSRRFMWFMAIYLMSISTFALITFLVRQLIQWTL